MMALKSPRFVCKCGKLRVWTSADYLTYRRVVGNFRLASAGRLGLWQLVCAACNQPPKR